MPYRQQKPKGRRPRTRGHCRGWALNQAEAMSMARAGATLAVRIEAGGLTPGPMCVLQSGTGGNLARGEHAEEPSGPEGGAYTGRGRSRYLEMPLDDDPKPAAGCVPEAPRAYKGRRNRLRSGGTPATSPLVGVKVLDGYHELASRGAPACPPLRETRNRSTVIRRDNPSAAAREDLSTDSSGDAVRAQQQLRESGACRRETTREAGPLARSARE